MRQVLILLTFWTLTVVTGGARAEIPGDLRVLVSIQPLAALTRAILGDLGQVDTLLPLSASPHHFALRTSDLRRLRQAHLVVWMGPALERPLQKPLAARGKDVVLTLVDLEGLHWPAVAARGGGHHSGDRDPHIWLAPRNGIVITEAIAAHLIRLRPDAEAALRRRADGLIDELVRLDQRVRERLAAVRDRGFITYHDGYGHFVQAYDLQQLGYVTKVPDRRPGARHLAAMEQLAAGCLLVDSAYQHGHAAAIAARWGLALVPLEPFGRERDTYPQLLDRLAENFYVCLNMASKTPDGDGNG
ncbi:metal ABC transporter solute-binding protein, Zn/Mn family [Exilibacterium tricleocarpae]|nr:zinc ABC transporter substrate-binding protein [Exilibacterium tricleocarpae]